MRVAASWTVAQRPVVRGDRPDGEERVERRDRPVREVGRRQRLGRDAAGLEQLERDLARGRELDAAADHEHPARVRERQRELSRVERSRPGIAASMQVGRVADAVGDRRPVDRPTWPASSASAASVLT